MRHVNVTRRKRGMNTYEYVINCYQGENLIHQHVVSDDFELIGLFIKKITEWLESES